MEEEIMWKCKACGGENGDSSNTCVTCGARRGEKPATAPGAGLEKKSAPGPGTRLSSEAASMESWADKCMIIAVVIAIIAFVGLGFSYEVGHYEVELAYHFSQSLTKGLPAALGLVVIGYTLYVLLNGLAVVVESSYRNMK